MAFCVLSSRSSLPILYSVSCRPIKRPTALRACSLIVDPMACRVLSTTHLSRRLCTVRAICRSSTNKKRPGSAASYHPYRYFRICMPILSKKVLITCADRQNHLFSSTNNRHYFFDSNLFIFISSTFAYFLKC